MGKINCSSTIDFETKQISILGLQESPLLINYSSDVDFTELVSVLSKLVDQKNLLIFTIEKARVDDKLNLIIETLETIFKSFNSKLIFEEELQSISTTFEAANNLED
jgi:archaellum biogenesis ATPase FlaH